MDPHVVAADRRWPQVFEAERVALVELLGDALVTDVEHVGSTSVPGLAAKPIIDMIAGVASLDAAANTHAALASRGYAFRRHRPEAHLFVRVDADGFDTHHLHLTVPGSALWIERLTFRDALRADPAPRHRLRGVEGRPRHRRPARRLRHDQDSLGRGGARRPRDRVGAGRATSGPRRGRCRPARAVTPQRSRSGQATGVNPASAGP